MEDLKIYMQRTSGKMKENNYDVVIIGAGVSGMTSAIYLKRTGLNCLLIEGETPGGQVTKTITITNYPGFKSITGAELATKMLTQVKELEVEILYQKVANVKLDQNMKIIVLDDNREIIAKNLIIATGRTPRKLGLSKEEKLTGRGVSYCATCDGALFKGEEVVVIGGGDTALEEAIYLSSLCKKVTLIHRREEFRAKSYLQEELKYIDNIEVITNANVTELIETDGKLSHIRINKENEIENIPATGCFIFIGYIPQTDHFSYLGITNEEGFISTNANMETNIKGIYAVGDVREKEICQIVTAASDGAIAAIHLSKSLIES